MIARERAALLALAAVALVTTAWWALALWPMPSDTPWWLLRAREVCFGSLPDTLPSRSGWMILIGEPVMMVAGLLIIWPGAITGGIATLARSAGGRVVLVFGGLFLLTGATAASRRITTVTRSGDTSTWVAPPPSTYPRLDRTAPPLALRDHRGDSVTLAKLRGRIVLVTFAYAHCMTACPITVREVLSAQRRLPGAAVVIVTLDPWRDTPDRLPGVAADWQLDPDAHLLGGDTAAVVGTLDAWSMPHTRDLSTGEVVHPTVVYIIDRNGRMAYAAGARSDAIVTLARRI